MTEGHPDNPFDLEQLRHVLEMMEKHELTDLSLRNGNVHWRLRRGGHEVPAVAYAPAPANYAAPPPAAAAPSPAAPSEARKSGGGEEGLLEIKSPTVGTFYAAQAEGEPPFVNVGSKVTAKTVVCLIEAMKVFNQIPADVNGTIAAVLVKNGEAVEFGQPLFKVRP